MAIRKPSAKVENEAVEIEDAIEAAPAAEVDRQVEEIKATATVPEDFGSASGDIAFVASLGDPSRKDANQVKGPNGDVREITNPTVVGYMLKNVSDHPITVPDFGIPTALRRDPMDYAEIGSREVAPGEEFAVTRAECGALISEPRYGTKFSGGEYPVKAAYTLGGKSKSGDVTVSTAVPGVSLTLAVPGSIKNLPFINVLEATPYTTPQGRTAYHRTPSEDPRLAKFASLSKAASRAAGKGAVGGSTAVSDQFNRSQAFLARLQQSVAAKTQAN